MNKIDSQVIVSIIRKRVGASSALTQYEVADRYYIETGDEIEPRTVRKTIEELRFAGVPILSSPHEPGGYYFPASIDDFYSWEKRELIKAKKQIAKIEPVRVGVIKMFRKTAIQQARDFGKRMLRVS